MKKNNSIEIQLERLNSYDEDHCWQYDIRLKNTKEDLEVLRMYGYDADVDDLRVNDFYIKQLETDAEKKLATEFIERHEWLGSISLYTTHWFGVYLKEYDILAGVLLFNTPNAFMKVGELETKKLERLISRGACISWSPKNLASWMIKQCIKEMVRTTPYRIFSCYSDPTAKELGTVYQACNFHYIGDRFGAKRRYVNPYNGNLVSDRMFRMRSMYKKYAAELGIVWDNSWNKDSKMIWDAMPDEVEEQIREFGKEKQKNAEYIDIPQKHKYVLVEGINAREKKYLNKVFLDNIKTYDYPKDR